MKTMTKEKVLLTMESRISKAYKRQEKTLLNLIETINKSVERVRKNNSKITGVAYSKPKQISVIKIKKEKKVKVFVKKKIDKITPTEILMEGLKQLGRPARVIEIADKLSSLHIPKYESTIKNKKKLKQILYTVVSLLSKTGDITRKAFDKKTFEYALPEWNLPISNSVVGLGKEKGIQLELAPVVVI